MIDYYSPREIMFNYEQTIWLLYWLPELSLGYYPTEPSSYTDIPSTKRARCNRANFETAVSIAAELKVRMAACGFDGYPALEHYADDKEIDDIARRRFMSIGDIERRISKVVWYICRHCTVRPWENKKDKDGNVTSEGLRYGDWKRERRYRRKQCSGTT